MGDVVIDLDKIHKETYGDLESRNDRSEKINLEHIVTFTKQDDGTYVLENINLAPAHMDGVGRPYSWADHYHEGITASDSIVIRKDGVEYSFSVQEIINASNEVGVPEGRIIGLLINSIDDGVPTDIEKAVREAALNDMVYKLNDVSDMQQHLEYIRETLGKLQVIVEEDNFQPRNNPAIALKMQQFVQGKNNVEASVSETAEGRVLQNELTEYFKSRGVEPQLAGLMADYIMASSDDEGKNAENEQNAIIEYVKGNNPRQSNFYVANNALLELVKSIDETNYYLPVLQEVESSMEGIIENHFPERGMKPNKGGQSLA